ncbi:protein transport protein SEC31-like [Strigops habroptila]|uniref:protein transport protein SEC31-like n=1 Tax=Strigops habroptila TaxID=2489341 RepID=UPI0011CF2C00|nr:protein transport protein SEC31-like [Strigops habroptila]
MLRAFVYAENSAKQLTPRSTSTRFSAQLSAEQGTAVLSRRQPPLKCRGTLTGAGTWERRGRFPAGKTRRSRFTGPRPAPPPRQVQPGPPAGPGRGPAAPGTHLRGAAAGRSLPPEPAGLGGGTGRKSTFINLPALAHSLREAPPLRPAPAAPPPGAARAAPPPHRRQAPLPAAGGALDPPPRAGGPVPQVCRHGPPGPAAVPTPASPPRQIPHPPRREEAQQARPPARPSGERSASATSAATSSSCSSPRRCHLPPRPRAARSPSHRAPLPAGPAGAAPAPARLSVFPRDRLGRAAPCPPAPVGAGRREEEEQQLVPACNKFGLPRSMAAAGQGAGPGRLLPTGGLGRGCSAYRPPALLSLPPVPPRPPLPAASPRGRAGS